MTHIALLVLGSSVGCAAANSNSHEMFGEHGQPRQECSCSLFQLHRFLRDDAQGRLWMASVNRKRFTLTVSPRVHSVHFVEGKRSERNPTPMLHLRYERKVGSFANLI